MRDPLFDRQSSYFEKIADRLLDEGPVAPMVDVADDLADESARQAPKDLSILARSNHPSVTDDGAVVYDRPPEVERLTDDELYQLHHGKPDLHGAGRRQPHEVGGQIVGHPGRLANPGGPR